MSIATYKDLKVWQRSIDLVTDVYKLSATLPTDERFGLTAQIRRAAVSIPANISEGNGRATTGEYLNHLSIARGSVNEVRTLLLISERLGFVSAEQATALHSGIEVISKMLWRLRNSLTKRRN